MALNINDLQLSDKNIIIVEDDQPSIRYYETLLRNSGADLKIFHNGREFVDYLSRETGRIDIVFMDFLIPLINGLECIRILRKERKDVHAADTVPHPGAQELKEGFERTLSGSPDA